ncbi:MAG: META domain-containing protein [Propionibacteriaceae bacterium]|nr:META domain-containing protein [Propionibacteriaceae bacterium]
MRRAITMSLLFALSGFLILAGCAGSPTDKLTATTWYLVSVGENNPSWQWTVPADLQARYTIRLEKDGTFSSQADCNQLGGSWEARGSDRLTITPGPMTMAFCGEMSFDFLYAGTLSQVRGWNVASTGMSLTLADGGRLDYTSVTPPSPSPSDDLTAEPTVASTPTPTPDPRPDGHPDPRPDGHPDPRPDGHADGDRDGHADTEAERLLDPADPDPDPHAPAVGHSHSDASADAEANPHADPDPWPGPDQRHLAPHSVCPSHAAVRGGCSRGPAGQLHDPVRRRRHVHSPSRLQHGQRDLFPVRPGGREWQPEPDPWAGDDRGL